MGAAQTSITLNCRAVLQLQKQQQQKRQKQHESGNIINNNCSPQWVCLSRWPCVCLCVCVRQQTSDSDRDVFEYCKNLMKCNHSENPANTFIVIASCYNCATTMAQGEPRRGDGRKGGLGVWVADAALSVA